MYLLRVLIGSLDCLSGQSDNFGFGDTRLKTAISSRQRYPPFEQSSLLFFASLISANDNRRYFVLKITYDTDVSWIAGTAQGQGLGGLYPPPQFLRKNLLIDILNRFVDKM